MPIAKTKALVRNAAGEGRAVGTFSVGNMEMVLGAIKAAEELNTPIILQIAQARLKDSPLALIGPMMMAAAKTAKVPVAVHLDHGLTLDIVRQALDLDFPSVMFDGSRYPLKQNMELTRQVVGMSRKKGADIEAELGIVGKNEDGSDSGRMEYTDPDVAQEFAQSTGIDLLAVAIGNAHGHYTAAPKLRFDILEQIHRKVQIPLVLHGGTGITPEDFRTCIRYGIRKINIATASFDALTQQVEQCLSLPQKHDYFSLSEAMVEGVYQNVKRHIQIFNNQLPLNEIE